MRFFIAIFILLPFMSIASNVELAKQFITLSNVTKVHGATKSDIEAVADLLSDNMRYQHPNYSADLSKKEFVESLVKYMGVVDSMKSKITNKIIGSNAVTLSFISTTVMDGKTDVDKQPLMRLFEFEQGKIALVKEYW